MKDTTRMYKPVLRSAPAPEVTEATLRTLEAQYCSHGDTVHYMPEPKYFETCDGSFLFDAEGRAFLDL